MPQGKEKKQYAKQKKLFTKQKNVRRGTYQGPQKKMVEETFVKPPKVSGKARTMPTMPRISATKEPDKLVKVLGGHGRDPSAQANQTPQGLKATLSIQGETRQMSVVATISDYSLPYAAMGMVLFAIRNGWMSQIKAGENPYYAFLYLIDILNQALLGATPAIQNAPKALWDFIAAIKPKSGNFKTGAAKYDWLVQASGKTPQPVFQLGNDDNPYYVYWGTMGTTASVNGFIVLDPPAVNPTDQQLSSSFQSMCSFIQQEMGSKMTGDSTGISPWLGDTSAFSVVYPELGATANSEGGAAVTIYSERNISAPILAKFAKYQPTGEYYRGWAHAGKNAGTASYILPRMLEMTDEGQYFNKASPIFKFFNFDEIFTVLSLTLGLALSNYYASIVSTSVQTCPLTSQEVQILLRQCCLSIFQNHFAQDLLLGSDYIPFQPFVVGPNGVSIDQTAMLLPTVLCENIRAMGRKQVQLSEEYKNYAVDYVPIIGRPSTMSQLGNYTTTINGTAFFVYNEAPGEVLINIIDCSTPMTTPVQYLSMNGTKFNENLMAWNEWITQLSGVLSPLTTIGAEGGIIAISSVYYTLTQQNVPLPTQLPQSVNALQKQDSKKNINTDERIKLTPCPTLPKRVVAIKPQIKNIGLPSHVSLASPPVPVNPSYLDSWTEKEIMCNQLSTSPVFRVIRELIMPCHLSIGEQNQASIQTWQAFMIEPFIIPKSEAGGNGGLFPGVFPVIGDRLSRQAAYDTKALGSGEQQNEMVQGLLKLGELGRGGFFAQLAGDLAGALVPGMGGMVSGLVSSLGL